MILRYRRRARTIACTTDWLIKGPKEKSCPIKHNKEWYHRFRRQPPPWHSRRRRRRRWLRRESGGRCCRRATEGGSTYALSGGSWSGTLRQSSPLGQGSPQTSPCHLPLCSFLLYISMKSKLRTFSFLFSQVFLEESGRKGRRGERVCVIRRWETSKYEREVCNGNCLREKPERRWGTYSCFLGLFPRSFCLCPLPFLVSPFFFFFFFLRFPILLVVVAMPLLTSWNRTGWNRVLHMCPRVLLQLSFLAF